jgi:hypothetical protein
VPDTLKLTADLDAAAPARMEAHPSTSLGGAGAWLPTVWDYAERLVVRAELYGAPPG